MEDNVQRKELGRKIKEARFRQGMSQYELAEKSGVDQSHISRIENGTLSAQLDTLTAIANALDVKLSLTDINQ